MDFKDDIIYAIEKCGMIPEPSVAEYVAVIEKKNRLREVLKSEQGPKKAEEFERLMKENDELKKQVD